MNRNYGSGEWKDPIGGSMSWLGTPKKINGGYIMSTTNLQKARVIPFPGGPAPIIWRWQGRRYRIRPGSWAFRWLTFWNLR